METLEIISFYFHNDGIIPNNSLPLLIYKKVHQYIGNSDFEHAFIENGWTNNWQNIILPYDHFHSNTHEVLGLTKGTSKLKIGGRNGAEIIVENGDVIIVPAGVGHYSLDNSIEYQFVGGYPNGNDWNLKVNLNESNSIINEIEQLPIPITDPIFGINGPLFNHWKSQTI